MRLRLWKKRVVVLPYAATIDFTVPAECDTLRIETLTGALTLNIIDGSAQEGDYFKLIAKADGSARVITIAGAQGAAKTLNLAINAPGVYLFTYHAGEGKYVCLAVA